MRVRYILTASLMTFRELVRRKIVIILLVLIPSVFYAVTYLTADLSNIPFKLAAAEGEPIIMIPARYISLVFLGLASAGILAAFLSMNLIQRNIEVSRRLIICGYTSTELALSNHPSQSKSQRNYIRRIKRCWFTSSSQPPMVSGGLLCCQCRRLWLCREGQCELFHASWRK